MPKDSPISIVPAPASRESEIPRPPNSTAPPISAAPPAPKWRKDASSGMTRIVRSVADLPVLGTYGHFALLGRLAFGGMAEVFLAREVGDLGSPPIVVKRILPHVADDPRFVQMFLDEARLGSRLTHPNLCRIYEFGEADHTYFIAMEWVNGVQLGRLIRRAREDGGIPHSIAATIIACIADALGYAHAATSETGESLGIVHRDVSLQNVMVAYDGSVKLLDFGVAKSVTHTSVTDAGMVKGKLAYMAPEQARGEKVDARADVFALGVCLYEALTCKSLYHRNSEYETLRAIIEGPVPSACEADPHIPEALNAIVMKALAKHPGDRYQSAREMKKAIDRVLEESGNVQPLSSIAAFVGTQFGEEIVRGPFFDATPTGQALSRADGGRPPLAASDRDAGFHNHVTTPERRSQKAAPRMRIVVPVLLVLGALLGIAGVVAWQYMSGRI